MLGAAEEALTQIEEPSGRNALLFEDLLARPTFGVVGEKPCCAQRNYTGSCRDLRWYILSESGRELLGSDDVRF